MILENHNFPVRLGGDLSLDFVNTAEFRDSTRCIDSFQSYAHLLGWCREVGIVDAVEYDHLGELAEQQPAEAADAFRIALHLREMLYRIFTAVIVEKQPQSEDLAQLNDALRTAARCIQPVGNSFVWNWAQHDYVAQVTQPIALAAANLLTSDRLQWIRQCPNCGWLFVDTSRNHSRRWCSMDFCGSKIKSRRQYERRKREQTK